jgi:hypothetical protein
VHLFAAEHQPPAPVLPRPKRKARWRQAPKPLAMVTRWGALADALAQDERRVSR